MTHIPYGYKVENGKAYIYEVEAEKIRKLYLHFLACNSMAQATRIAGINKLHPSIGRILKNKVYLGTNFYPQLIDKNVFYKVQKLREENAIKQNRIRAHKPLEKEIVTTHYYLGNVETKYDNAYKQSEYAYSQIKQVK